MANELRERRDRGRGWRSEDEERDGSRVRSRLFSSVDRRRQRKA